MASDELIEVQDEIAIVEESARKMAEENPGERWALYFLDLRKTLDDAWRTGRTENKLMSLTPEARALYDKYKALRGREFKLKEEPLIKT